MSEKVNGNDIVEQSEATNYSEIVERSEMVNYSEPIEQSEAVNYSEAVEQGEAVNYNEPIKQQGRFPFSQLGLFYFGIAVGINVISIIIMIILGIVYGVIAILNDGGAMVESTMAIAIEKMTNLMPLIMLGGYAIAIPLCMLILKGVPAQKNLPKVKWKISKLALIFVVCIGAMTAGNYFSQIVVGLFGAITGSNLSNPVNTMLDMENIIGSIALVVLIAPIVEEFLFRKILIDRVRVYGDKLAIILSGIMFGIFHGNLFQVVYAFLLGAILAYVYLKTNQIKYCIGLHMAANTIGGIIPMFLYQGLDLEKLEQMSLVETVAVSPQIIAIYGLVLFDIICMIIGIVMAVRWRRQASLCSGLIEIPKGERFKTICLNAGMILFFISCMAMFMISLNA